MNTEKNILATILSAICLLAITYYQHAYATVEQFNYGINKEYTGITITGDHSSKANLQQAMTFLTNKNIHRLDITRSILAPEMLTPILQRAKEKPELQELVIQENFQTPPESIKIIADFLRTKQISVFEFSNNVITPANIIPLIEALSENPSVMYITLNHNFDTYNKKIDPKTIETIIGLFQKYTNPYLSLAFVDGKIDLTNIIMIYRALKTIDRDYFCLECNNFIYRPKISPQTKHSLPIPNPTPNPFDNTIIQTPDIDISIN